MSTQAVLEIHVHLEDGRVTKFDQTDPVMAHRILEAIHPSHLFAAPRFMIGSEHELSAFQPRLIVRVDVITDLEPNWPYTAKALNTREITEDEFNARSQPNSGVQRLASEEIVVFSVWEMVTGARIYLQTHLTGMEDRRLPIEMDMLVQSVLNSGGLLARRRERGYIILNPVSLLRLTSHLGLQEMPVDALRMRRISD